MKIAFDRVYTFLIEILSDGKVEYSDTINVACVGREDAEAILDRMIGENEYKIKDTLVFDNIINYLLNHNKNTIYNLSDVEKHYGSLDECLQEARQQTEINVSVNDTETFERIAKEEGCFIERIGINTEDIPNTMSYKISGDLEVINKLKKDWEPEFYQHEDLE